MKKLIKVLATSLVDNPDEVEVREIEGERALIVELSVASDDMGKVIGKQGKIARAIRALAKAKGNKVGKNVVVEIVS
ncbi:MAG: KH domain-containing protein [Syntrophaceticus sp.]|nr:KH domain-containing protein [Syntrophaceticus sp.]MDD3314040.1 KH domain-containing protein [Syntrophaceticus sp.]MDD4358939.1 KH domain-containing protein [Syntrophaceticus sp.]MDD4782563.1 KH domain-containing protein [Syntrophaceticus sp.]HBI26759.1 RNA-binding protein [Peptococcaceae bacterium]